MYRNKSAVSLRTLAHSLKQSINMDRNKVQTREFKPLRGSASSMNLTNTNHVTNNIMNGHKGRKNLNEDQLIMFSTRKSGKYAQTALNQNQDSSQSLIRYDINSTRQLMIKKKQKLIQMTRCQSIKKLPIPFLSSATVSQQHKRSDQIISTIILLQQQQTKLKEFLQQNTSSSLKSCTKHINQSQTLAIQLKEISTKHHQFIEYKSQLENRKLFLREQIISIEINRLWSFQEKDKCQLLLKTYQQQKQFKDEIQSVLNLIQLQYTTEHQIPNQLKSLQMQLQTLQQQYTRQKLQQNIEFKQQKFLNKINSLRFQLLQLQQHLDLLTQQFTHQQQPFFYTTNSIRKIRQYICVFFRKHNQVDISILSKNPISEGIEFLLCKQGFINQFTQFVNQQTQKITLIDKNYSEKLAQYCLCLQKIQILFQSEKNQLHTAISSNYESQITSINNQIQSLASQKQSNLSKILSLQQNIEEILTKDSESIIKFLSKKDLLTQFSSKTQQNLSNLTQIKKKIKEIKLSQLQRIQNLRSCYFKLKKIQESEAQRKLFYQKHIKQLYKQIQTLNIETKLWQKKIEEIELIKQAYESKKSKCDKLIDQALSIMKQKDKATETLSSIQKQIQILKKQKIQQIQKKHQSRKTHQELAHFGQTTTLLRPFSSLNNLNIGLKSRLCSKINSYQPDAKIRSETLKINPNHRLQEDQRKYTQLQKTKEVMPTNLQLIIEEQKISTKTQSSPKNYKQRLSIGALNSIILSKCNIVSSKNLQTQPTQSKCIKNLSSNDRTNIKNKENQFDSDDFIVQSKAAHSRNNSNLSRKQDISRKTSISKISQRTIKNQPINQMTKTKLSLSTNTRKPSLEKSTRKSKQNPLVKSQKPSQKDLTSLITNKLLGR